MRRRSALALLLALATVPAVPGASGAQTAAQAAAQAASPALTRALTQINRLRAQAGAAALTLNPKLTQAAQRHAADMAANDYLSHTSRDGRSFVRRIEDSGYTNYTALGENIAAGQRSWYEAFVAWRGSPGHRANMLSRDFKEVGLGAKGGYWVQDFGAARGSKAASPAKAAETGNRLGAPARLEAP